MTLAVGSTDAVLLATTTNPVITTSAAESLVFLKVTACNTDGSTHQVYVYRVPSGGSVTTGELLVDGQSVASGATAILPLSGQTLLNGASLYAKADTGSVVNFSAGWATL